MREAIIDGTFKLKRLNIIYSRVSKKDETLQDLEIQEQKIIEKFELKQQIILKERGTAYNLEFVNKREKFIELLNLCFNANNSTIIDLFLQKYEKKRINIYVWDLNRIMRNLKFNLLFSILSLIHEVSIYSYNDHEINYKGDDTGQEFFILLLAMMSAKKAEDYSKDISKNVRKHVVHKKGVTYSTKGNKWGAKFNATKDNLYQNDKGKVELTPKKIHNMQKFIYKLKSNNLMYKDIIQKVAKKYKVKLSNSYISRIKG